MTTIARCYRCNRDTQWRPVRGGSVERCDECGDRFPCASNLCGHLDCRDARPHQQHLTDEEILNMTTTKAKTTKTTKTKATKAAKPKAAAKKSTKTTKPKATAAKKSTKAAKPAAAKPVVDAPKAAKEPKVKKEKVAYDRAAPTDANPDGKTVTLKNGSVVPAFKYCANCDADHAAEEFYANAGRPSGLSDWCKAAFKAWKKASDAKKAAQA